MLAIGNNLANSVWEACPGRRQKPRENATREEKETWIRCKYEAKEFLLCHKKHSTNVGQELIEAVIRSDLKCIILILASATSDVSNSTVSSKDVRTSLLLVCAIGNLAITQLLIWNHANIKHTDHEGRTCLTYARTALSLAKAKSLQAVQTNSSNTSTTSSTSSTYSVPGIPIPHYNLEELNALVELLLSLGCPEAPTITSSGTLPRRRETLGTPYEKSLSHVI